MDEAAFFAAARAGLGRAEADLTAFVESPRGQAAQARLARKLGSKQTAARSARLLSRLLATAHAGSPYYRRVVAPGLEGRTVTLRDFPVLTKPLLRAGFADLVVRDPLTDAISGTRLSLVSTSGSTGEPCSTLRSRKGAASDQLVLERLYADLDLPRRCHLWDVGLRRTGEPLIHLRIATSAMVVFNLPRYSAASERRRAIYRFVAGHSHPALIYGAASRLLDLAAYCLDEGVEIRPRAIVTSYEQLPDAGREFLTKTFDAPVRSLFGTAETGLCAWECAEGNMHFDPDAAVAEIVDAAGAPVDAGTPGRLLVTALTSDVMPIIRYDTGDRAVAGHAPCACGRWTPYVTSFEGRAVVTMYDADGLSHSAYPLLEAIASLGVANFQVQQRVAGQLDVVLADPASLQPGYDAAIRDVVARVPGGGRIECRISGGEFVETPAGKRHVFVSLLAPTQNGASDVLPGA